MDDIQLPLEGERGTSTGLEAVHPVSEEAEWRLHVSIQLWDMF